MNHNTDHIGRMAATLIDGKLHQAEILCFAIKDGAWVALLASGMVVSVNRCIIVD